MKIFHCDHCQQLVFFENVRCLACGHSLAYVPTLEDVLSLEPAGDGLWRSARRGAEWAQVSALRELRPREHLQLGGPRRGSGAALRIVPPDARDPRPHAARPQGGVVPARGREATARSTASCISACRSTSKAVDPRARCRVRVPRRHRRAGADRAPRRRDHDQRGRGRRRRSASSAGCSSTSPTGRCSGTSATRSATTTGTGCSPAAIGSTPFARCFGDERADYAAALQQHYDQRRAGSLAGALHQRLRQHASVGGLGRDLGALPAHDRRAGDGRCLRLVAAPTAFRRAVAHDAPEKSGRAARSTRRSTPGSR